MAAALDSFTINAILCDSAATADAKLYIHGGGWNTITAPTFPCLHSRLGIAAVLEVPYTSTNANHKLEISIQDEDGKLLQVGMTANADGDPTPATKINAAFNAGRPPLLQAGDAQSIPFAVNIEQIKFDAPGAYCVLFHVNDEEVARLRFRVNVPPAKRMRLGS